MQMQKPRRRSARARVPSDAPGSQACKADKYCVSDNETTSCCKKSRRVMASAGFVYDVLFGQRMYGGVSEMLAFIESARKGLCVKQMSI